MRKTLLSLTLLLSTAGLGQAALPPGGWPSLTSQLANDHVQPGSALERLIAANQDFNVLRPEEAKDQLHLPLWLRVICARPTPRGPSLPRTRPAATRWS